MAPIRGFWKHCLRTAIGLASLLFLSCGVSNRRALLWTDCPEILAAVDMYNAAQTRDLVEVCYVADLPAALADPASLGKGEPSFVLGRGLKAKSLADKFLSLNHLQNGLAIQTKAFYPGLLQAGRRGKDQILLPVSFNILLIVGKRGVESPASSISMDEIRRSTLIFNDTGTAKGERLGFSPRWPDEDFLFQWAQIRGVGFGESNPEEEKKDSKGEILPLSWNADALDSAVVALSDFIRQVNGSPETEDAYAFKYLFAPGYQDVDSGKLLFTAMDSSSFFLLPPLTRAKLEFRYFGDSGRLAVRDDITYAGILNHAGGRRAAEGFLRWLFKPQNQAAFLERSKTLRISESAFGVAGGFSTLSEVTEAILPKYYSDLAGKVPASGSLRPPATMPPYWDRIKKEFVLPWLSASTGLGAASAEAAFISAFEAYLDKNPGLR
ncbi:MAG: hypothetical protein NT061_10110 [Spirochaetes bacterium]|nr:hypothetical protein [Spirochaetota bacterium]